LPAFYLLVTAALAIFCLGQLRRRPEQPVVEDPGHFVPMVRTGTAVLELHPESGD
jgi:hypothetical protein